MRKAVLFAATLLAFAAVVPSPAQAQQIRGDYIESRSTDVYVAQCFANGEVGLTGNQALLAWHVEEGSWDGVKLDGLTIAAAVRAKATLGDPYGDPYPAQSVLMVDSAASPAQRQALIALAKHQAGRLLENVVRVDYVPVILDARRSAQRRSHLARRQAGDDHHPSAEPPRSHLRQRDQLLSAADQRRRRPFRGGAHR